MVPPFGSLILDPPRFKKQVRLDIYPNREYRVRIHSLSGKRQRKTRESENPLLLTQNLQKSSKPVRGYGELPTTKEFRLEAHRKILRYGGALDQMEGDQSLFYTITLPGSTLKSLEYLARYSAYFVKRIKQYLLDLARSIGESSCEFLYVWEFQKRGALHLHAIILTKSQRVTELIRESLVLKSWQVLEQVSDKSGVDLFERDKGGSWRGKYYRLRGEVKELASTPAAYLAKYLGKQKSKRYPAQIFYPSRWWGCTKGIREKYDELRYTASIPIPCDFSEGEFTDFLTIMESCAECNYYYRDRFGDGQNWIFYADMGLKEAMITAFNAVPQLKKCDIGRRVTYKEVYTEVNLDNSEIQSKFAMVVRSAELSQSFSEVLDDRDRETFRTMIGNRLVTRQDTARLMRSLREWWQNETQLRLFDDP